MIRTKDWIGDKRLIVWLWFEFKLQFASRGRYKCFQIGDGTKSRQTIDIPIGYL